MKVKRCIQINILQIGQAIKLVVAAIALYTLWRLRHIVALTLTAILLATALNRLVRYLQKFTQKREIAVVIIVSGLVCFLAVFLSTIVPFFVQQVQTLILQIPEALERVNLALYQLSESWSNPLVDNLINLVSQGLRSPQALALSLFRQSLSLFSNTLESCLQGILILVLSVMLLTNPRQYRQAFTRIFPAAYRQRLNQILDRCEEGLGKWSMGNFCKMAAIILLTGIGLKLLAIPFPLANAFLAGIFAFIPFLGSILAVIPPLAVTLLHQPWKAVGVLLLYLGIQLINIQMITPSIHEKQLKFLPAITLLVQITLAYLFGFLGLFLALPLAIVAQIIMRELRSQEVIEQPQT